MAMMTSLTLCWSTHSSFPRAQRCDPDYHEMKARVFHAVISLMPLKQYALHAAPTVWIVVMFSIPSYYSCYGGPVVNKQLSLSLSPSVDVG